MVSLPLVLLVQTQSSLTHHQHQHSPSSTRKGGPVGEGRKPGVWEFAPPGGPKLESHSPRATVRATGGLPGR
ncbi:hypothetical protein CsSME_00036702 [Camellia sinensis var. sinensis]